MHKSSATLFEGSRIGSRQEAHVVVAADDNALDVLLFLAAAEEWVVADDVGSEAGEEGLEGAAGAGRLDLLLEVVGGNDGAGRE